ncbi:MAG: hypothetical protein IPJ49_18235 [Candidatus Obscuribacter sp.]|nr:hypothetical protein [Candidatus Obscuribacter sp.]
MEISSGLRDRDGERVLTAVHSLLAQGREPSLVALELSKHFLNMTKALHLGKRTGKGDGEESVLAKLISGSSSYIESILKMAPEFEGYELTQMVEQLDRMEQTLRRSTQPALSLEVGLLSLCHRQEIHLVKDLVSRIEELERAIAGGAMPTARYQQAPASHSQPTQSPAPAPAQHQLRHQGPSQDQSQDPNQDLNQHGNSHRQHLSPNQRLRLPQHKRQNQRPHQHQQQAGVSLLRARCPWLKWMNSGPICSQNSKPPLFQPSAWFRNLAFPWLCVTMS